MAEYFGFEEELRKHAKVDADRLKLIESKPSVSVFIEGQLYEQPPMKLIACQSWGLVVATRDKKGAYIERILPWHTIATVVFDVPLYDPKNAN